VNAFTSDAFTDVNVFSHVTHVNAFTSDARTSHDTDENAFKENPFIENAFIENAFIFDI